MSWWQKLEQEKYVHVLLHKNTWIFLNVIHFTGFFSLVAIMNNFDNLQKEKIYT